MRIEKILYVEDNSIKYVNVVRFLRRIGIEDVSYACDSAEALKLVEQETFDLIMLDMHFKFEGKDDIRAGEKTMSCIREKGIDTPIIFCSSQNWKIPGTLGNIFFNERRDWEREAEELFRTIKTL